jgi:type II secretory pathway component PulJ
MIHTKKGFTLIEAIVYIALLSGIMTSTYSLLFSFSSLISYYSSEIEIETTGSFILQTLESQMKTHTPIVFPTVSSSTQPTQIAIGSTTITFFINNHYFSITQLYE